MIYIYIYILITIYFLFDIKKKSRLIEKKIKLFFIVLLWFLAAFRYETGGDWPGYYSIYEEVPLKIEIFKNYIYESRVENGFLFLVYIIKKLNLNKQYLFIISTSLAFTFMIKGLKMIFKNNYTSWRLFFIFYFGKIFFYKDFVIMRQSIAASLVILGVAYFLENKMKKFVFSIFGGILFHKSVFLVLPIILLSKIKIKKKYYSILLILSIFLYFLKIPFLKNMIIKFHSSFPEKYLQVSFLSKGQLFFSTCFLTLFFITLYRKNSFNIYKTEKDNYFKNLLFFSLIPVFLIYESKEILLRMEVYFNLFNFVSFSYLIPKIYKMEKKVTLIMYRINILVFIIVFTAYGLIKNIFTGEAYNPYQNYLLKNYKNYDYEKALERLERVQNNYIESLNNKK